MTELSAADRVGMQLSVARCALEDGCMDAIEALRGLESKVAELQQKLEAAERKVADVTHQRDALRAAVASFEAKNDPIRRRTLWGCLTGGNRD